MNTALRVACIVLAVGMSAAVWPVQHDRGAGRHVFLTEHDNRHTFAVTKGEVIVVKLPFASGTAFTWKQLKLPDVLTVVAAPGVVRREVSKPGGPGSYVLFKYEASAPGRGLLKLGLTGANGRMVSRSFEVTIRVGR